MDRAFPEQERPARGSRPPSADGVERGHEFPREDLTLLPPFAVSTMLA